MMRKVLLDTNLLIAAFDPSAETSQSEQKKARQIICKLLTDKQVTELAITPLIRYEVLRYPDWLDMPRYDKLKQTLNGIAIDLQIEFREFEITKEIAELAADLYRFDKHDAEAKGIQRNLEKRKFDVFHLATAKTYGLELASNDSDISKLETLYAAYQQAKSGTP